MRTIALSISLVALLLSSSLSVAAEKTILLSIPGMDCPSCPFMIEKSISAVDGVKSAAAVFKDRTCSVVFDDAVTGVDDILKATANIGYKATVIKSDTGS